MPLQREASIDYGEVGFAAMGHSGHIIVEAAVIISQVGALGGGVAGGEGMMDSEVYVCGLNCFLCTLCIPASLTCTQYRVFHETLINWCWFHMMCMYVLYCMGYVGIIIIHVVMTFMYAPSSTSYTPCDLCAPCITCRCTQCGFMTLSCLGMSCSGYRQGAAC